MSTELDVIRYHEKMDEVVSLYARGAKPSEIIRETGVSKKDLDKMLADFRDYSLQDKALRERARETLLKTQLHYDAIVAEMYEAMQDAKLSGKTREWIAANKAIADIEKQRVDFMQKAGMMVDNELSEQLIEHERKQQIMVDILQDISKKYPDVGREIQKRLSEVAGGMTSVPSERLDD